MDVFLPQASCPSITRGAFFFPAFTGEVA